MALVDQHREQYGVEPICSKIQIVPSSYYEHKARERDPDRLPDRTKRDRALEHDIKRVWENNTKVYGVNKVWRQLIREGIQVARCTVERLMKKLGIQGTRRGKKYWATRADVLADRPTNKVSQQFVGKRSKQLEIYRISFFLAA
ncbi:IS3 family transposase [Nitrosomonas communis]|uniref:HTH-like domain-containing protein n=1 Tax=Nitrosomonas communis TaxID=44574 RepID=A0A1I4U6I8_9PROT|nr:IS3 family transposase [Nitrosomonas communis]SFM84460.1 HTH-like domain-containing protein [Nitrosomonas communis]